jgi:uncharacterized RDD family membrane protein YckC
MRIASIRRRLLARAIDSVSLVAAVGAFAAVCWALDRVFGSGPCTRFVMPACEVPPSGGRPLPQIRPSWSQSFDQQVAREIALRNVRSPGKCVLRIRRVDASTYGPVTVTSAVISKAVRAGSFYLLGRAIAPARQRALEQWNEYSTKTTELKERYGDDGEGLQRALMEASGGGATGCLKNCGMTLFGFIPFTELPALLSPLRQGLADRLAGTVVIVEN